MCFFYFFQSFFAWVLQWQHLEWCIESVLQHGKCHSHHLCLFNAEAFFGPSYLTAHKMYIIISYATELCVGIELCVCMHVHVCVFVEGGIHRFYVFLCHYPFHCFNKYILDSKAFLTSLNHKLISMHCNKQRMNYS